VVFVEVRFDHRLVHVAHGSLTSTGHGPLVCSPQRAA